MPITRPSTQEDADNRLREAFIIQDFGALGGEVESYPLPDRNALLYSSATSAWAERILGVPANPYHPGWQGQKDGIVRSYFGEREAKDVSDEDLFGKIATDYRAQEKIANAARIAAARGESWLGKFREVETQEAGSIIPGRMTNYLGLARAAHDEMAAKVNPYRNTIKAVADMARNIDTSAEGMDWGAMASELVKIPKEDRPYVLEALSLQTPGESKAGDAERIKTAFVRGMERYLDTAVSSLETAGESTAGEFLRQSYGFDVEAQTPEQKAQRADFLDLRDDMRDIATGKLAPLKAVKIAGMNIAGAAEMLPMTLGSFVPYVGAAVTLGSFQRSTYNDIRRSNPEMSRDSANSIATVSAPFQAITEIASDRFLFGRLPNLKRAFTQPIFSATGALGMFATRAAIGTATEVSEEFIQGVTPLAIQDLSKALDQDLPGSDWNGFLGEFAQSLPELISTILPLAIVGAGTGQLSDFRAGRQLARSPDMLIAAQYSPESAAKISELANAGKWSEAEDAMRLDWAKINAKGADMAQVKATAEQRIQAAERLKSLQSEQANTAALIDTSSPEFVVNVTRSPAGWQVAVGDGTIIPVDSAEAARRIAVDLRQVGSQQEADALVSVIDGYYEQGRQAETVFTGETVQASDVEAVGVVATRRDAGGAIISQRQLGPQALETVRAEAEVAGIKSGTQGIFAHINGSNEVFPMRVADGAKEIVRRMNLYKSQAEGQPQVMTFLHENFESTWRLGIENGTFSDQETRTAMRALLPAFEGVTALNAEEAQFIDNLRTLANGQGNETMLRETVSEMVMRDVLGRDRQGLATGMKPGSISRAIEASVMGANTQEEVSALKRILAVFRAFSAYLKGVFSTVKAITKARDEGKLGEEYDTFVNKVLGIDEVKQMEGQAIDEAKAMLGVDEEAQAVIDAGNMAFSMSRAQPTDTSNVTEMPEGAQLVGPTTFSITAYHGTPHKVDRFRMAKIGTGEGAQAYGWGLYFAESRMVAKQYQASVTSKQPGNTASLMWGIYGSGENFWIENGDLDRRGPFKTRSEAEAALLEVMGEKGNLYTVELLPDEEDFLDWDKPLSEQSEKVKNALRSTGMFTERDLNPPANFVPSPLFNSGRGAYDILKSNEGSDKKASELLAFIGIAGMKYFDSNSRNIEFGTRNYVIFDESLVKILEENGQKVDAGNMAFSISPVTPEQDAAYLALAKEPEKNRTLLQKMVDAVAKAMGYNTEGWHAGTVSDTFDIKAGEKTFRHESSALGAFFGSKDQASEYGNPKRFYLQLDNPLKITERKQSELDTTAKARLLRMQALKAGHDGAMIGNEIVAFKSNQIKSADPVTYDDAGNVIPLSQRFNPETPNINFSVSPIRNLNELSDQVERQFKENPAGALEVKSKVIRQFAKLADKWSNERWTPQGNKIRPISEKRTVKSLDKEQAMRQATLEGEKIAANMEASQALKEAKAEAQSWRDEADAMQKEDWSPRESLVRDLITLEAIVAMFPQEIRGKIGGFVTLARKASESARLKVLQRQLERGQELLEKHLKEQYGTAVDKLFDKYRPERKAGEKPKGKLDPDAQEIADKSESVMDLNADQVNAEIAAINVLLDADNISAEDEAKLEAMRELVQLLGDWKNADSARRESAFLALNDVLSEGWAKWKLKQLFKREQREDMRKELKSATGKKGVASERDKMKLESAKVLGKAARWVLNLSSFGEVMKAVFGEKAARQFIDNERNASNQYEDAIQEFSERIDEFFTTLAGGVLRGERLRFDLAQPTLTIGAGGMNERNISQLQGIQALLMWQQEDGKRHMEGPRDESGAPIEGKWSYDQAWIDELTSKLSPEAVEVKKFIEQLYSEEWVPLNAVYRERHGVNLPRHDKYAPITVTPQQAKAGEMVDPVSGAAIAGSILTPGSLRSRNRSALAEPEFRDALSTFIAHTKQMEHWKAYYDLAVEMQAVLGNRDVANSVKAAVGDEGATVLRKWVDAFAQGGTRDAAAGLAVSDGLGRLAGRVATVGLLGRFSTLLVQSTQLAAASIKMPTGAYLKRFALLMSGNLQWSDAINSEFIQRRIKSAPPIIRQAFQSLGEATRPNEIQRVTRFFGQLLSGADGLFTAGTYAILLDYHRTQGAKMGMEGEALESYAHEEAVNATEQVAQPVRTGTRSIVEVTNTNPLAKMSWAYASEARQKMALFAWSAYNAKNDPAGAAKTAFLVFVIGGLMSQVLKNLWREAKGDDDEKKWSAERLSMSMLSPITSAIPGASMLAGEGGSLSGAEYAQYAIKDVFDGKADMKDVDTLLSVAGYFNDTAGGISTLSHAGYDFAKVLENAFGEE